MILFKSVSLGWMQALEPTFIYIVLNIVNKDNHVNLTLCPAKAGISN